MVVGASVIHASEGGLQPFEAHCRDCLRRIREEGRYRTFIDLQKIRSEFPVYERIVRGRRENVVVWSSNDYLGMGCSDINHDAAIRAIEEHGVSSGGTRNVSG